jgi:hypothetical protein
VWSPSDGVIQFYDSEAKPLRTVNLLEEEVPQLMAA